jgi:quinol monooxygenase YgiN
LAEKLGLLVLLEAKPGKGDELGAMLQGALDLAIAEAGTVSWYAFKAGDDTYGIFDTFADDEGRQAHLGGDIAKSLGSMGDLLSGPPNVRFTEILAAK